MSAPAGTRLVLATHNAHKIGELRAILVPALPGLDPASIVGARDVGAPEPVEDGVTFAENALGKARAAAQATGRATIADDSGIGAAALTALGAPAVASARSDARLMVGPSASGSEKGKPTSTMSAPPSTAARASSGVSGSAMR